MAELSLEDVEGAITITTHETRSTPTVEQQYRSSQHLKFSIEERATICSGQITETSSPQPISSEQRRVQKPDMPCVQNSPIGNNLNHSTQQEPLVQTPSEEKTSYISTDDSPLSVPGSLKSDLPVQSKQNEPLLHEHPESQKSCFSHSSSQPKQAWTTESVQQQQCPPAEDQLVPPDSQRPTASSHPSTIPTKPQTDLNLSPGLPYAGPGTNTDSGCGIESSMPHDNQKLSPQEQSGPGRTKSSLGQHAAHIRRPAKQTVISEVNTSESMEFILGSACSSYAASSTQVTMAVQDLSLEEVESLLKMSKNTQLLLSPTSEKDSINSEGCPSLSLMDETEDPSVEECIGKEKKIEEDEEEKEKCEATDADMEIETDNDINNLAQICKNTCEEEISDSSMHVDDVLLKKSEDYLQVDSSPVEVIEERGLWPALAVAERLRNEKKKKEEAEAAIRYDEKTGIEVNLYEKMINKPEELTPKERDLIQKQMSQHLQKKAAPPKKEKSGVPFDPDGKLTEYQKELAQPGLMGFNYIMCSPTRTGKVLTVAAVCDYQRREALLKDVTKPYKALFITDGSSVKERHKIAFEEIFPSGNIIVLDNTLKFKDIFERPNINVIMLPAARLADALAAGELSFTNVNTIVIDECHLTALGHTGYKEITKHYLTEKKAVLARKAPRGAWTLGRPYGGISYVIGKCPHTLISLSQVTL